MQRSLDNAKYRKYLKSSKWAELKDKLYTIRGRRCERCQSENDIQVHHKTYRRIFNEDIEDLEILCSKCHKAEHDSRDLRKRQEEERWMAIRNMPNQYKPLEQHTNKGSGTFTILFLLFITSYLIYLFLHIEICGIICGVMFFIFVIGYAFARGRRR